MATVNISKDQFTETIQNNDIVLFDFWAEWCAPCRSFGPVYEAVSDKHPDLVFAKVNTEEEQELAAGFNIRSIPTLAVMREQIVVFYQPGMLPESALEEIIGKVKELDMDMVREEIGKQQVEEQAG